jgi:hypothetical protein
MLLGKRVSVGPLWPERDGYYSASRERLPPVDGRGVPALLPREPEALERAVLAAAASVGAEGLSAEPGEISTTLHHDGAGRPSVLFAINSSPLDVQAVVAAPLARSARDCLTLETVVVRGEHAVLPVPGRSIRMLELSSAP